MSAIAPPDWKRKSPPADVQKQVLRGRLMEAPLSEEDDDAHEHHPRRS